VFGSTFVIGRHARDSGDDRACQGRVDVCRGARQEVPVDGRLRQERLRRAHRR
jgi:hypothetical protein